MSNKRKADSSIVGKKGKRYKLIGGAILLLAFVAQSTLGRYVDAKRTTWNQSLLAYAYDDLSSLAHLNLFFTQGQTTGVYDPVVLRRAATEHANGLAGRIAVSDKPRENRITNINTLLAKSNEVHDLDSYNAFIATANELDQERLHQVEQEIKKLDHFESVSVWGYLILYMCGSILVLIGELRGS